MNQVRIKRDFGELVIDYSSLEDLEKKLDGIDKVTELVLSRVGTSLLQHAQRQPKPGYEDIYRFLPDGTVELLLYPSKNVQKVGLVLFAYDQAIPPEIIEKCTNIPYVTSNVLQAGPNKKYFVRTRDGKYSLSPQGISWITSTVIRKVRQKTVVGSK